MAVYKTIIILTLMASVGFCLLTISRVLAYNRRYHLPESKYTKVFRFLQKEHVAVIYAVAIAIQVVTTTWFLIIL